MMVLQQRWPKSFIADSSIIHRPVLRLATSQESARGLEILAVSPEDEHLGNDEGSRLSIV